MKKFLLVILVLFLLATLSPMKIEALSSLSIVNFVITPNSTNSFGTYIVDLKLSSDLTTDNFIYINFPDGFSVPESISTSLITVNGEFAKKIEVSSSILKIYPPTDLQKNQEVVIRIDVHAFIKNPEVPGDFGFLVGVSNESSPQNVTVKIEQGITHLNVTVQPNSSNSNAVYLVSFYTSQNGGLNGSNGDYITLTFPAAVQFEKNTLNPEDVLVNGFAANSVNLTNNILTIYLNKSLIIAPNSFVLIQILQSAKIKNPSKPGDYILSILTNKDPFFVNTLFSIYGTSIKNLHIVVSPRIQNASSEIRINFITSDNGSLEKDKDKIFIVFPEKFTFPNEGDFTKISVNNSTCSSGQINENVLSIVCPIDIDSGVVNITISKEFGVKNPSEKGEYTFKVYTSKDLTPVSLSVQIESSHITAPYVELSNSGAGTVSGYKITFYTGAGGKLTKDKSTITVVFPEGTMIPKAISANSIKLNNTTLKEAPVVSDLSLKVTTPVAIEHDSKVELEILDSANIKNPSTNGIYTLTVWTSEETTPVFSIGFEISLLPHSSAKVVPAKPDGKNGYYITTPIVQLNAESPIDSNPAIYYYFDNGSAQLYSGEKIEVPDGVHTLYYYAIDHMGHKEKQINSIPFKVDTKPPEISILSPTSSSVNGNSVKLLGKTEKGATVIVNGTPIPVDTNGKFQTELTGNGKTNFEIKATDIAGNSSTKTISITFNVNPPSPPSLSITSPQDGTTVYEGEVVVSGKTDLGAEVQINGENVEVGSDGTFSQTVSLKSGDNVIDIKAEKNGAYTEKKILVKYVKAISMKLQINNKNAIVNGEVTTLDTPPTIVNGRTLVPLRFISESFGAQVSWDPALRIVEIRFNGTVIKLQIDNKDASVNGEKIVLDTPPQIINGRTMVPLRFIAESFKAHITWDPDTKTITITYP